MTPVSRNAIPDAFQTRIQKILELKVSDCENEVGRKDGVIVHKTIEYVMKTSKILRARTVASMTASIKRDIRNNIMCTFSPPQIVVEKRIAKLINYLACVDGNGELHSTLANNLGLLFYYSHQLYHVTAAFAWIEEHPELSATTIESMFRALEDACVKRNLIRAGDKLEKGFIINLQQASPSTTQSIPVLDEQSSSDEDVDDADSVRVAKLENELKQKDFEIKGLKERIIELEKNLETSDAEKELSKKMLDGATAKIRELEKSKSDTAH